MKNEPGTAVYDQELRLEAYRFHRCSFPKHFHEYYVIGYIADGQGLLICRDVRYALEKGNLILYNPGDLHSCSENGAPPDYWGLHIPRETMLDLTGELTGRRTLPVFSRNVVSDPEAAWDFRALHRQIMDGSREFGKEERLLLLLSRLLRLCGQPFQASPPAGREAVERARAFMEEHCGERITLERVAGAFAQAFARLPRQGLLEPAATTRRSAPPEPRVVTEEMDVSQGKLGMGFRTQCPDVPANLMLDAMFGGTSTSKLFLNVRERLSLCYYAGSSYHRLKGLVTVSSGIECENYERAVSEISAQLEALKAGAWEDWELQGARSSLLNSLRSIEDSAGAMEDFILGQTISGLKETVPDLIEAIGSVTGARIQAAAQALALDTIYFLKGKET